MTLPLRRLIASVDNGTWGSEAGQGDVDVACVRAADFDFPKLRVDLRRAPTRSIDAATLRRLALRRGDIVLEKSGGGELAPVGRAVMFESDISAVTSNFAARVRPAECVDPRFLVYLLQSLYSSGTTLKCIKQTTGIQNLDTEHWLQTSVHRPEMDQQRRIADFLDDRVARIDQIITARRHQAALLESTKLAWLRRVTEGVEASDDWTRPRVAHVFRTGSGSTPPSNDPEYYDGQVPWVNTGDVRDGPITVTARTLTEAALAEFSTLVRYPKGSLVIAMYGQGATKGRVGLLETDACVNQACCVLQHGEREFLQWAFHWFRAHKADIVELANGAGQPNLSQDILRNVRLALPLREELAGLLTQIEELEAASIGAREAVDAQTLRLQEYKQALITAAVTGELDVTTAGNGIPS